MTATTPIEAPLSQHPHCCGMLRHYPNGPARDARIEGDQHLLVQLERACRDATPFGKQPVTVAELGEDRARAILEHVERLHLGRWQVERQPGGSVIEALDAHFLPLQEARAAEGRKAKEHQARLAAAAAERPPGWPFDLEAKVSQTPRSGDSRHDQLPRPVESLAPRFPRASADTGTRRLSVGRRVPYRDPGGVLTMGATRARTFREVARVRRALLDIQRFSRPSR